MCLGNWAPRGLKLWHTHAHLYNYIHTEGRDIICTATLFCAKKSLDWRKLYNGRRCLQDLLHKCFAGMHRLAKIAQIASDSATRFTRIYQTSQFSSPSCIPGVLIVQKQCIPTKHLWSRSWYRSKGRGLDHTLSSDTKVMLHALPNLPKALIGCLWDRLVSIYGFLRLNLGWKDR